MNLEELKKAVDHAYDIVNTYSSVSAESIPVGIVVHRIGNMGAIEAVHISHVSDDGGRFLFNSVVPLRDYTTDEIKELEQAFTEAGVKQYKSSAQQAEIKELKKKLKEADDEIKTLKKILESDIDDLK